MPDRIPAARDLDQEGGSPYHHRVVGNVRSSTLNQWGRPEGPSLTRSITEVTRQDTLWKGPEKRRQRPIRIARVLSAKSESMSRGSLIIPCSTRYRINVSMTGRFASMP